ncbi:ADP-ribosylglycohydrolase family protein [Actinocorallia lasiicapitis]
MDLSLEQRKELAYDSLHGLSAGDAYGNRLLPPDWVVASPGHPDRWAWTDDTQMACSLVDVLNGFGRVDQDALAAAFASRAERFRDYGMGADQFITRIGAGEDWRVVAPQLFENIGSWGNGGAMRVAPLGAWFADDLERAAEEAALSAEITHAHPEGIAGAIAIAVAAGYAASRRGEALDGLIDTVLARLPDGQVRDGVVAAAKLAGATAEEAALALGNGARISAPDTVPFCVWAIANRPSYADAVRTVAESGGDRDTTAAIVGGVRAAHQGVAAIPADWLERREPLPGWLDLG